MSTNAKSYAKNVLDGYADTLKRLTEKYTSVISSIDREHNAKKKEIEADAVNKKSAADASNRVSLHNTKAGLLDKGLSASGESSQAEIDHNLARNTAFSAIDTNASRAKEENENSRAQAKANAFTDYINSVNSAEQAKNTAYIKQLNSDRDYEADRSDEIHDRYVDSRNYEAARSDEIYDRFADNRDYEADRSDEAYDRYADNRDYEADRSDEVYDRYADNRDYEAGRSDETHDRYVETQSRSSSDSDTGDTTSSGSSKTYQSKTDDRMVLEISPEDLVKAIRTKRYSEYFETEEKRLAAIRRDIKAIADDMSISYAYRHELEIYARALGIY